ncbi:hypothetical protein XENORESO_002300 [Xenotaenia resolanae]|uniref:Uncharacterized protein n=1 Tax=Xenotaenia resolanae TaxID=208358 RepID=A0ABV0VPZ6_9TELE
MGAHSVSEGNKRVCPRTKTEKKNQEGNLQIISRSSAYGPNKPRSEHLQQRETCSKKRRRTEAVHSGRSALIFSPAQSATLQATEIHPSERSRAGVRTQI